MLYGVLVIGTAAGMLAVSYVLGPRQKRDRTTQPYESGMTPTGPARSRVAVEFYLVAVFFVIFDLEAVFVFAWAVAARALGWAGYVELVVFLAVLVSGLAYLWRRGAFDWTSRRGRAGSSEGGR